MEIKFIIDGVTLAGIGGLIAREIFKSRQFSKNGKAIYKIRTSVDEINTKVAVMDERLNNLEENDQTISDKLTTLDERIFELVRNKSKGG